MPSRSRDIISAQITMGFEHHHSFVMFVSEGFNSATLLLCGMMHMWANLAQLPSLLLRTLHTLATASWRLHSGLLTRTYNQNKKVYLVILVSWFYLLSTKLRVLHLLSVEDSSKLKLLPRWVASYPIECICSLVLPDVGSICWIPGQLTYPLARTTHKRTTFTQDCQSLEAYDNHSSQRLQIKAYTVAARMDSLSSPCTCTSCQVHMPAICDTTGTPMTPASRMLPVCGMPKPLQRQGAAVRAPLLDGSGRPVARCLFGAPTRREVDSYIESLALDSHNRPSVD